MVRVPVQQLITNLVGMRNVASLKLNQFSLSDSSMIEGKTVIIGVYRQSWDLRG